LSNHSKELKALAEQLLEKEVMDFEQVKKIVFPQTGKAKT